MTSDAQHQWHRAGFDSDKTSPQNDIDYKSTAEDDVASNSPVLQHRNWVQLTGTERRVDGVVHSTDSSISHKLVTASDSAPRFRVATYNILSDNAIKPGEYLYCPPQLRYMSSRHERIVAEIRHMQPHVICFQVSCLVSVTLSSALFKSGSV